MSDKLDDLLEKVTIAVTDMKHVREKVDAIDNKVQTLNDKSIINELTVASAHKRIDEIAPLVHKHETVFIEASGGKKALSGVWALVVSVGSMVVAGLSWLLK